MFAHLPNGYSSPCAALVVPPLLMVIHMYKHSHRQPLALRVFTTISLLTEPCDYFWCKYYPIHSNSRHVATLRFLLPLHCRQSAGVRSLKSWARLTRRLGEQGWSFQQAVAYAFEQVTHCLLIAYNVFVHKDKRLMYSLWLGHSFERLPCKHWLVSWTEAAWLLLQINQCSILPSIVQ